MTLDPQKRRECRQRAQSLEATLQVGKAGLTEALVKEAAMQLKDRKLVKVKVFKGDVEATAQALAAAVGAALVEVRGKTAVFWKD